MISPFASIVVETHHKKIWLTDSTCRSPSPLPLFIFFFRSPLFAALLPAEKPFKTKSKQFDSRLKPSNKKKTQWSKRYLWQHFIAHALTCLCTRMCLPQSLGIITIDEIKYVSWQFSLSASIHFAFVLSDFDYIVLSFIAGDWKSFWQHDINYLKIMMNEIVW